MAVNFTQTLASEASLSVGGITPFSINVNSELVSSAATETLEAGLYDAINKVNTGVTAWNEFILTSILGDFIDYSILTPSTAYIDGNRIGIVGNGGFVLVKASKGIASIFLRLSNSNGVTKVVRFDTYAEASVSGMLANNVLEKITSGKVMEFFTNYSNTQTGSQTVFTKNPDCWAYGYDMSGCAIDGTMFGVYSSANKGALITNQHLLGARHWLNNTGYSVGWIYRFRGADGSIHSRQIIGVGVGYRDCVVATLDSPLPASVSPFKLAGNWQHRSQIISNGACTWYNGGVAFFLDQQYKARFMMGCTSQGKTTLLSSYQKVDGSTITNLVADVQFENQDYANLAQSSLLSGKTDFFSGGVTGDSGSGIFYDTGIDLALIGTFLGPVSCPAIGAANGEVANDLILRADLDAVAKGNLVSPTGKTVVMAADPTL